MVGNLKRGGQGNQSPAEGLNSESACRYYYAIKYDGRCEINLSRRDWSPRPNN